MGFGITRPDTRAGSEKTLLGKPGGFEFLATQSFDAELALVGSTGARCLGLAPEARAARAFGESG